jgi:hypothetical protein
VNEEFVNGDESFDCETAVKDQWNTVWGISIFL